MQIQYRESQNLEGPHEDIPAETTSTPLIWIRIQNKAGKYWAIFIIALLVGLAGGYVLGRSDIGTRYEPEVDAKASNPVKPALTAQTIEQINPPEGYALNIKYGDLGPHLLAAGAFNYDTFIGVFEKSGQPLSNEQSNILKRTSDRDIVFNRENAHFLLNFFWALGLANENPILTDGPMVEYSDGQIERFASTGGWTIAAKPISELYAGAQILSLTPAQQTRVDEVAGEVYRPCCNNPTIFPDCNHGMAMLGMLELLSSQDATIEQMFEAAKYANAFWFPQQTLELALFHKADQNLDFSQVAPRQIVGPGLSSGSGFQAVHQWLIENEILEGSSGEGSSCGV